MQENLNNHAPASLYEAFEPAEARRIIERFEWHYTPKHGSWLNLAESELAVLSGQCLARRIADVPMLAKEADAWRTRRNTHNAKAPGHSKNPPGHRHDRFSAVFAEVFAGGGYGAAELADDADGSIAQCR